MTSIDDKKLTEKDSGRPPKANPTIRVHFYLGPVCRSEIINPELDFEINKKEILSKFGIGAKLTNA